MAIFERGNNFGFLRLLFAILVIITHSSAIIYGDGSPDLLTMLIGHRPLGTLAVDGFFLVSGYLVTKSYVQSHSAREYLLKRIRRIYPGYLAAYLICLLIIAPVTGVSLFALSYRDYFHIIANGIGLQGVLMPGFIGLKYEVLNGSMWTIAAEFRCYILVLVLGVTGIFARHWLFLLLAALTVLLSIVGWGPQISGRWQFFVGEPDTQIRLIGTFLVGACFYLFHEKIAYRGLFALIAAAALLFAMYFSAYEAAAFTVFGGYLVFWFAFAIRSKALKKINSEDDVSYGIYLYAWPISSLLVYFLHVNSAVLLFALTVPLAYLAGWVSWRIVERPALRRSPRVDPVEATAPASIFK